MGKTRKKSNKSKKSKKSARASKRGTKRNTSEIVSGDKAPVTMTAPAVSVSAAPVSAAPMGDVSQVRLQQILLTDPIVAAIQTYRPDFDPVAEGFKMSKKEGGFGLSRMDRMMEADIDKLLEDEPVELEHVYDAKGVKRGRKIDGVGVLLYDIVNGRHRVARSIIEGRGEITADIIR